MKPGGRRKKEGGRREKNRKMRRGAKMQEAGKGERGRRAGGQPSGRASRNSSQVRRFANRMKSAPRRYTVQKKCAKK